MGQLRWMYNNNGSGKRKGRRGGYSLVDDPAAKQRGQPHHKHVPESEKGAVRVEDAHHPLWFEREKESE